MLRKMMVLASGVAVVLAAAAPALAQSGSANNSGKLVDIGGGRKMYMECQGKGSPTVVFVSGGSRPRRNMEQNARPIQAGGVARDRRNQ